MRVNCASVALLLLLSSTSAQTVAPVLPAPTNLTLSCNKFPVRLQWEYSHQTPLTQFRVTLGKSTEPPHETSERHYTLNSSVWSGMESFMAVHVLNVTALQGHRRSHQAMTFSFNHQATVDTICNLDLPPLHLTHSGTVLTFRNPIDYYPVLRQAVQTNPGAAFAFEVSTTAGVDRVSACETEFCRWDSPEAVDECVNVSAWLWDSTKSRVVAFRTEERVCSDDPPDLMLLAIILVCVLCLAISVLAVIIYKCQAYELSKRPQSNSIPDFLNCEPEARQLLVLSDGHISGVEVLERDTRGAGGGDRAPPAEDHAGEGSGSDVDSRKTESDLLEPEEEEVLEEEEEEEVERGDYERRDAVLWLDMGDGEMVTGYGGAGP